MGQPHLFRAWTAASPMKGPRQVQPRTRHRSQSEVPRISEFYGVLVAMYHNEHSPPHFHASYGGREAAVSFDGTVLRGSLPPRALRLVREWSIKNRLALDRNWSRVRRRSEEHV